MLEPFDSFRSSRRRGRLWPQIHLSSEWALGRLKWKRRGGQSKVRENGFGDGWLVDGCDDFAVATAEVAFQNVDCKTFLEEKCPIDESDGGLRFVGEGQGRRSRFGNDG